jgi:YebC/PmpR family DNA-binding regulatory protein
MSGHSKWATIKHKKGAADKARGKLFAKLIRQVEVAAREGGGDIESNATLRTMFQKARDASVPTDTIDRAIKRGTGELEGVRYEPMSYEGYAPCGVAVYVECLSDNRNRTGAEVRNLFTKNGGSVAEPGAVAWQFERKGVVLVPAADVDEDALVLTAAEAEAEDVELDGSTFVVTTAPEALSAVRAAVEDAGFSVESVELAMIPKVTVAIGDESIARSLVRLVEGLEEADDVQDVYANFDIPETLLEAVVA